jgi:hypothetical protein
MKFWNWKKHFVLLSLLAQLGTSVSFAQNEVGDELQEGLDSSVSETSSSNTPESSTVSEIERAIGSSSEGSSAPTPEVTAPAAVEPPPPIMLDQDVAPKAVEDLTPKALPSKRDKSQKNGKQKAKNLEASQEKLAEDQESQPENVPEAKNEKPVSEESLESDTAGSTTEVQEPAKVVELKRSDGQRPPSSEYKRQLTFEWEPVEGADHYQVEMTKVQKSKGEKPALFKRKTATFDAKVNPGRYRIRLRSFDSRKVPGDWNEPFEVVVKMNPPIKVWPKDNQTFRSKEDDKQEVEFVWKKQKGISATRLEIREIKTGKSIYDEKLETNRVKVEIPIASRYEWKVTYYDQQGTEGEGSSWGEGFAILGPKIDKPKLETPDSKFVRELAWNKPNLAKEFNYVLLKKNEKSGKWEVTESNGKYNATKLDFKQTYAGGKYQLKVQAVADGYLPSDFATVEFPVASGDRSPAAAFREEMRETLEKRTNAYFVASYLLTSVEYTSIHHESGGRTTTPSIGGTGRVGIGYFFPESKWGALVIADMSGVIVSGTNYTYSSAEAHLSWRTYFGISQLRASGGLYFKELPLQYRDFETDAVNVENVSSLGPHLGFDYWYPLSKSFGVQLNTRMYVGVTGSTPNGEAIEPQLSYQLGLLGSLRLTQTIMGFLGYAYRVDAVNYAATPGENSPDSSSFASEGNMNEVKVEGHYLNLFLEWGF